MKKTIGSQTETNGTVLAALGAGTICNMITNPLSVIRARMLLSDKTSCGKGSYDTLGRTLAHIARNEGISGFYKVLFNYLLSNRAATAGKAGKVWSLPRFWVFIRALIRNNRSKNFGVEYWTLPGSNSPWRI